MNIPSPLKVQVIEKIEDSIRRIDAHFGIKLPMPKITFDLRGQTAGTASAKLNHIRINGGLLVLEPEEMIDNTTPHELAHLATAIIFPEAMKAKGTKIVYRQGRPIVKRFGRNPHGQEGKSIMRVLGADPSRCHDMDTSSLRVNKRNVVTVQCCNCSKEYRIKDKRYVKLVANPLYMWCRCSSVKYTGKPNLFLKGFATAEKARDVYATVNPVFPPKPIVRGLNGESKIDLCRRIYANHPHLGRGEMIALFQRDAGCTKAGASTYYYTIQKG